MKATIHLNKIQTKAIIGAREGERHQKQPLIIDAAMEIDVLHIAESDQLTKTQNYSEILKAITSFVESSTFMLLEALLIHLAKYLLDNFSLLSIHLICHKPLATSGKSQVSVEYFQKSCN